MLAPTERKRIRGFVEATSLLRALMSRKMSKASKEDMDGARHHPNGSGSREFRLAPAHYRGCGDARCWRQCNARRSRGRVLCSCPVRNGAGAHRARSHPFTGDSARASATAVVGARSSGDLPAKRMSGKASRQRPCGIVQARRNRTAVLTPQLPTLWALLLQFAGRDEPISPGRSRSPQPSERRETLGREPVDGPHGKEA